MLWCRSEADDAAKLHIAEIRHRLNKLIGFKHAGRRLTSEDLGSSSRQHPPGLATQRLDTSLGDFLDLQHTVRGI